MNWWLTTCGFCIWIWSFWICIPTGNHSFPCTNRFRQKGGWQLPEGFSLLCTHLEGLFKAFCKQLPFERRMISIWYREENERLTKSDYFSEIPTIPMVIECVVMCCWSHFPNARGQQICTCPHHLHILTHCPPNTLHIHNSDWNCLCRMCCGHWYAILELPRQPWLCQGSSFLKGILPCICKNILTIDTLCRRWEQSEADWYQQGQQKWQSQHYSTYMVKC